MDDRYYMEKALDLARKTLAAGEFPVGCVIVSGDRIVAAGARTGSSGRRPNELDHAEIRALRELAAAEKTVAGPPTLYTTLEPCLMCLGAAVLSNIKRIVYAYEDVMGGSNACDVTSLAPLYANASIVITPHVLRDESLDLFKTYFADPKTSYLKNSLLAEYTLNQK